MLNTPFLEDPHYEYRGPLPPAYIDLGPLSEFLKKWIIGERDLYTGEPVRLLSPEHERFLLSKTAEDWNGLFAQAIHPSYLEFETEEDDDRIYEERIFRRGLKWFWVDGESEDSDNKLRYLLERFLGRYLRRIEVRLVIL
jgi:hypothetical protein